MRLSDFSFLRNRGATFAGLVALASASLALTTTFARPSADKPSADATKNDKPSQTIVNQFAPKDRPFVIAFYPEKQGYAGGILTISGRDFAIQFIKCTLNGKPLQSNKKTATSLEFALPAVPVSGRLVISYGNADTEYVMTETFAVLPAPSITDLQPRKFQAGDTITLTGTSLQAFKGTRVVVKRTPSDVGTQYDIAQIRPRPEVVGISFGHYMTSQEADSQANLLHITSVKPAADGKSATMVVQNIYCYGVNDVYKTDSSGQSTRILDHTEETMTPCGPTAGHSLEGYLDFYEMQLAAPVKITYAGTGGMTFSKLTMPAWLQWGKHDVDFLILDSENASNNRINFEGRGLAESKIFFGTLALSGATGASGGWALIPLEAKTGALIFKKGTETLTGPVLKVVAPPKFEIHDSPYHIPFGKEVVLPGWYLLPEGVPGLKYTFDLSACEAGNFIKTRIIEHSRNRIKFIVEKGPNYPATPGAPGTKVCGGQDTAYRLGGLSVEANGEKKLLARFPFVIDY